MTDSSKNKPIFNFVFESSFFEQDLPLSIEADWRGISGTNEGTLWLIYILLKNSCGVLVSTGSNFLNHSPNIATSTTIESINPGIGAFFIICFQMDRFRHDASLVHIVCNNYVASGKLLSVTEKLFFPGPSFYLPFPPQIGLLPRNPHCADKFLNLAYVGNPKNLDKYYRSAEWAAKVKDIGMNFIIRGDPDDFTDFRNIDCVLAIRGEDFPGDNKPCSKLWNAWRAGVPIICGNEISFQENKKTEFDFIQVANPEECLMALRRLKQDDSWRGKFVQNGIKRSQECAVPVIMEKWERAIVSEFLPLWSRWKGNSGFIRQRFTIARGIRSHLRRIKNMVG